MLQQESLDLSRTINLARSEENATHDSLLIACGTKENPTHVFPLTLFTATRGSQQKPPTPDTCKAERMATARTNAELSTPDAMVARVICRKSVIPSKKDQNQNQNRQRHKPPKKRPNKVRSVELGLTKAPMTMRKSQ